MEKYDYKQEIEETRTGCLGSSDAKMVAMIQNLGNVPKSCFERLAIVKGLQKAKDHIYTKSMEMGDKIENEIFNHLKSTNPNYQSNPLWISDKYSRKNVKAISHPDIVRKCDAEKTLYVYEIKASKYTTTQVRQEYKCQLYWHYQLAIEQALKLGREWKYKIFLVHYDTSEIEDFDFHDFDPNRLVIKEVRFHAPLFDINKGMDIIDDFLETFNAYYQSEEIDANLLPQDVYGQFLAVCDSLSKIKEMETGIEAFKKRIYDFMCEKDIKSIKNEFFAITRIDPSESVSFDFKRYLEDYAIEHPQKAKALIKKYEKRTKKRGYATIKVKQPKSN